jgi:hypothetical protein
LIEESRKQSAATMIDEVLSRRPITVLQGSTRQKFDWLAYRALQHAAGRAASLTHGPAYRISTTSHEDARATHRRSVFCVVGRSNIDKINKIQVPSCWFREEEAQHSRPDQSGGAVSIGTGRTHSSRLSSKESTHESAEK